VAKQQPFTLIYDPEVAKHLAAIESKYHSLIRGTIEQQLLHQPGERDSQPKAACAADRNRSEMGIAAGSKQPLSRVLSSG
jgi:hypothetical protein